MAYWQGLSADLEPAIANQFLGSIDPAGNVITVDIDGMPLTSPFASGATVETARLSGRVEDLDPAGSSEVRLGRDRDGAGRGSTSSGPAPTW